jgi:DsbC/DsbD-like thiol-disulfide interchange protein
VRQETGNSETGNRKQRTAKLAAVLAMACLFAGAQEIQLGADSGAAAKKGHVVLLSDALEVEAGKPAVVELRFRVDQGFHVNSHTPASDLSIPTVLKLENASGVKVLGEEYPKGSAFKLADDTLDVYQGEFRVRLRVVVPKGQSTLKGGLRYQACDNAACFPPRTLAVNVAVTGK